MIRFTNVNKIYDNGTHAIKGVSFLVDNGEFVFLVGPSGSGKSTILKLLTAEEPITRGSAVIDGFDLRRLQPSRIPLLRRRVGVVYQDFRLIKNKTVEENLAFAMRVINAPWKTIPERVHYVLDLVGLVEKKQCYPTELSGGEQQRVAIARALINNPRVLLLDEPLGALDLKLRKQMQIELKRLQKKLGITFVYVTHDQEEAMTMSDRIAVMRDGVILQMGAPMEIYERPATRFVADFIGESNVLEGRVTGVKEGMLSVETPAGGVQCWGQGFGVGDALCVAIRPEYLRISREPVDGFSLPATVKDFIYMGALIKTSLDLKNGQEVKLSRLEADSSLREGDAVHLWWEAEKAVAIHDDSRQGAVREAAVC